MAIGIDRVYRTVLSIANKEQGGFITPDNIAKIGGQVQLSILEDNIAEYRNLIVQKSNYRHANNYGDLVRLYEEKLDSFFRSSTETAASNIVSLPSNSYHLLGVYSTNRETKYEEVNRSKLNSLLSSPLTKPSVDFPIYYKNNDNATITLNPTESGNVSVDFIKKPEQPRWGYFKNANNGAYIYDSNLYADTGLVVKDNALTSLESNISGGTDGTYNNIPATRSDTGGTIDIGVIVDGGEVVQINTTEAGTGFIAGTTLTVLASTLGATGVTSDLVVLIEPSDIYNNSTAGTINFDLHPSDEVRLVTDILAYMGIVIRDANISQIASNISQTKEIAKQS